MSANGRSDRPVVGITFCLLALAIMSAQDGLLKWLTTGYATFQILAIRGVITVAGAAVVCGLDGGLGAARTQRSGAHLVRGTLNFTTIAMFVTSVAHLPLADAMAIAMVAPMFTLALSRLLLGEKASVRRWIACAVGFGGVLIMLRPGGAAFNIGGAAAVGAAFSYALLLIQTRRLTETESNGALVLYSALVVLVASACLAPLAWVTPALSDVGLMFAAGVCVSLGHYWLVMAYRNASPVLLAPFDYTALIWGLLIGMWVFGDAPDALTLAGAALVVGAGLTVMRDGITAGA